MDEQANRRFFIEAREKAQEMLGQAHVGEDAKNSIRDLIAVAENFRVLAESASGQSADVRVAKRRLNEQNKQHESRLSEMRKMILSLATEIEMVSVEANQIMKRRGAIEKDPDADAVRRIQASAKRITDVALLLAKTNSEAIKDSQAG